MTVQMLSQQSITVMSEATGILSTYGVLLKGVANRSFWMHGLKYFKIHIVSKSIPAVELRKSIMRFTQRGKYVVISRTCTSICSQQKIWHSSRKEST